MKKLFAFLFVALLFVGVQDVWAETINACVNNTNGNTRILAPNSNSEECRNNESPVSWSANGGGNGNTMTITESVSFTNFCDASNNEALSFDIECPGGKILIGRNCESDTEITNPTVGLSIFVNDFVTSPFSNALQKFTCQFFCFAIVPNTDNNGTVIGTAICAEP